MKTTCGNHALARSVVSGDARVVEKVQNHLSGILDTFLRIKIAAEGGDDHFRKGKSDSRLLNITCRRRRLTEF